MRTKALLTVFFSSALLCACGGGGGGTSGDETTFPRSGVEADISLDNAELIAASTYTANAELAAAAFLSGDSGILLDYTPGSNYLVTTVLEILAGSPDKISTAVVQPQVVIPPETERCVVSGFITVSANIRDPDGFVNGTLSAGDEIFADFDNCNDGDGILLNGGFDFTVTRFTGNIFGSIDVLGIDIDFRNLSIDADGQAITYDGDASLLNEGEETTISGNSLVLNAQGVAWEQRSFSQTTDETGSGYSVTASGMLETTLFVGSINYTTPVPFASSSDTDPETGEILITGQSGESILLTFLGQGAVQLEVDADGDGEYDSAPIATTLDALLQVLTDAINN